MHETHGTLRGTDAIGQLFLRVPRQCYDGSKGQLVTIALHSLGVLRVTGSKEFILLSKPFT